MFSHRRCTTPRCILMSLSGAVDGKHRRLHGVADWHNMCIHTYIHTYIHTDAYLLYTCKYVCMFVCMHVCVYVRVYASMYLSIHPSIHSSPFLLLSNSFYPSEYRRHNLGQPLLDTVPGRLLLYCQDRHRQQAGALRPLAACCM